MGVFGAVFGCRGDAGFSGALLGVSSGVVGFNVAMFLCPVREIFRPAWAWCVREREKVRPARPKRAKDAVSGVLGEFFASPSAAPRSCRRRCALHTGGGGGFAALYAG